MIVHQDKPDSTSALQTIQSGEWQEHPQIANYRAEWLSGLLVERVRWREDTEPHMLEGIQIGEPGGVWFRFWLPEPRQIIEKYFNAAGEAIGIYMPVSDPIQLQNEQYTTTHLFLGLWLAPSGRLTVVGEDRFEDAIEQAQLSDEQIRWAEARIREINADIHRDRLPPPLIRNFSIEKG
jgi:predicted RNA-binding protein associated with RNAse of E/G family